MWVTFFIVVGIIVAILCVFAAIRLFREKDRPVNLVTSEQMDEEDASASARSGAAPTRVGRREPAPLASACSTSTVSAAGRSSRYASRVSNDSSTDSTASTYAIGSGDATAASASATSPGNVVVLSQRVCVDARRSSHSREHRVRERGGVAADRRSARRRRPARASSARRARPRPSRPRGRAP